MIATLEAAIATARAMKPHTFKTCRSKPYPGIVFALHGDGNGLLLCVNRDYKPIAAPARTRADYAAKEFDHLRCWDTPGIRACAVSVNERGRSDFPGGVVVPILFFLAPDDDCESYAARLRKLIWAVRS